MRSPNLFGKSPLPKLAFSKVRILDNKMNEMYSEIENQTRSSKQGKFVRNGNNSRGARRFLANLDSSEIYSITWMEDNTRYNVVAKGSSRSSKYP